MSDTEGVDYLQPGFDPATLTNPRLRSILVTYNITYPSNAKKGQLVDLFNEHIAPQAKRILARRARAKRSSMGIVDAETSQSQSTATMDDYEVMPPPVASTRARSPRKSTRVKQESEEPEASESAHERRSPRKRQSRSVSQQAPPTASDTDTGPDGDGRRSVRRARTKTPQAKLEPQEEVVEEEMPRPVSHGSSADGTVFTSDNPFQSGSSPSLGLSRASSGRRKTTGTENIQRASSAAAGSRRRTDGPILVDGPSDHKFSRSYEIPLSRLNGPKTPEPQVDAGEEFTPEEQLELAQEEEAARDSGRRVVRRPEPSPPRRFSLSTPLWVLVITLIGAYAAWYRQEKIAVGYCGLGRPATSIIPDSIELPDWVRDIELPSWAKLLVEPQCEPCPPHAFCYEDFSARCENGYVLKPHPLALGGIVPLPPTCEPDSDKVRRVKVVADKAVEELRDRRAKWECGDLVDEEGQRPPTPAVEEQVLKEVISEKRSKKMSKEEFDDLWSAALGEVKARDEVVVEVDEVQRTPNSGALPNTRLCSTSLARLPLGCALRRSIRLGVARYRFHVSALALAVLGFLYARSRYRAHRATSARIPALVDIVLERLAAQKELSYEDGGVEDPFLFLPHLRDDVLRTTHSLAERERVWQRVRAVVEQNSNVRTGQREGHNGEVGRAWEWIGPSSGGIGAGGDSARRRRSGRVSWGPDVPGGSSTSGAADSDGGGKSETGEKRSSLHRTWPESRPIY